MKILAVYLWIASALTLSAQTDVRGHWTGSIDSLGIEIDLDKVATGWIGSFSMPVRGMSGIPLESVTFAEGKVSFVIRGSGQRFAGTLSTDARILDGAFASASDSHPANLTRTGEAKVDLPKPNPAVSPEFLGSWAGTIQFDQLGGPPLRVAVTISNTTTGAEAQVVSLDQGNTQLPVNVITQKGTKLTLEVKVAGGLFEGEINKTATEINGAWSQMGNRTALVLKKAAAPAK